MKFLNRKEQVIDIELTSYGRHLLSVGKLKPEFYAFFDDDVVYDAEYAGFIESQNSAQDRIKETPRLEPQSTWHGSETEVLKNNRFIRAGEKNPKTGKFKRLGAQKVQPTPDKHYSLSAPLGTMSLDADDIPAWSINFLKGEISGSTELKQGNHPTVRIPQVTTKTITYETIIEIDDSLSGSEDVELELEDNLESSAGDIGSLVSKFEDGSFIKVFEDFILLEIDENNTFFENDNFDIEVYEIEQDVENNNQEILKPLSFRKTKPQVINGILLDDEDRNVDVLKLDPSYVDYFFDVLVDDEIDIDLLCKLLPADRAKGIFNQRNLICPEESREESVQLYNTDVREEDLEDC